MFKDSYAFLFNSLGNPGLPEVPSIPGLPGYEQRSHGKVASQRAPQGHFQHDARAHLQVQEPAEQQAIH